MVQTCLNHVFWVRGFRVTAERMDWDEPLRYEENNRFVVFSFIVLFAVIFLRHVRNQAEGGERALQLGSAD